MSILLDSIYRDINATLSSHNVTDEKLYHQDTVKAINDAIASLRIEYIQRGQGFEFAETEQFYATMEDIDFPFVKTAFQLNKPLLRSLPIYQTVLVGSFPKSEKFVVDEVKEYMKGELVIKGSRLYTVTEHVEDNIFESTFTTDNLRYYVSGIKYSEGDVVTHQGNFYKATEDIKPTENDTPETLSEFEKVYLRDVGKAYIDASYVSFDRLHELTLKGSIDTEYFTIKDTTIFTTAENVPFTLTYIPEWKQVEDLDEELHIPDTMIRPVKQHAIAKLANKFGLNIQLDEE